MQRFFKEDTAKKINKHAYMRENICKPCFYVSNVGLESRTCIYPTT